MLGKAKAVCNRASARFTGQARLPQECNSHQGERFFQRHTVRVFCTSRAHYCVVFPERIKDMSAVLSGTANADALRFPLPVLPALRKKSS